MQHIVNRRGRQQPRGRQVNGILLLDKPTGITSNEALQLVKHLYHARKAGHTGSLDKMATGLLPLCFGEATKFSGFLLDADKHYIATCRLGARTTTGDAMGQVIEEFPVPKLTRQQVETVMDDFRGEIEQIPPMYSALKHKGQRLYALAYQGIEVERAPRKVTIHQLDITGLYGDSLDIEVRCTKGTYIRTLAEDIGRKLGCGAHVSALRRIGAGPFRASAMQKLEDIEEIAGDGFASLDNLLLRVDAALQDYPGIELNNAVASYLCDGQAVTIPHAPTSGMLRLYNDAGNFLGVGEVLDDGRVEPRRLVTSTTRSK